jgi:signal transduction histidine kinase
MPASLFTLGIISICVLLWTAKISERQRMNFSLADALMDMQNNAAVFHLWFEEGIYEDTMTDFDKVWADIDEATRLARVILNGGESQHGLTLQSLNDSNLRTNAEDIITLLERLEAIARQRYERPDIAGIGSPLDEDFDRVFREMSEKAGAFELNVEKDFISSHTQWEQLSSMIFLAWTIIVIAATLGLWSRETRRRAAEDALQESNEKLRIQALELDRHRGRLLELVEERTAALSTANRELQQEIIERKQAVEALQESKNRFEKLSLEFHTLLDAIPDCLTLLSPEMKVLWANKSAESRLRRGILDQNARLCYRLWSGRATPCDECPAMKTFHTGNAESAQIAAYDGSVWDVRTFPIEEGEGQVGNVIEIATDITEKLTLQAETVRVSHLASLGELAAGVAHEINNPINGIINYAQVLIDDGNGMSEEVDILNRIIKEGNRIATIVRSLLSFARETRAEKAPFHVHEILSETLALSGRQMEKDGIILKLNISQDLPLVVVNPQQMQQVFLNIVNNARYALNLRYPMSDPNKIFEISAEKVMLSGRLRLRITFHDHGIGIPAAMMNSIRDPFFSTKPKGQGTGLGLSISHGIITDHGGGLQLHSVEKSFTKVQIILPIEENHESENSCN